MVVGAGISGRAVSQVLAGRKGVVTLSDTDARLREDEGLKALDRQGVCLELGPHREETFLSAECIVVSPGVSPDLGPLKKASRAGIPVVGEVEIAASLLKGRIIAVTGTNGKSSATSLIGTLLGRRYDSVFVGGNLGTPLSAACLQKPAWEMLVVELSSFQLETIRGFHPSVGVLLNITPDHLDRYPAFEDYVSAKERLFLNMDADDLAVINAEDETVAALARKLHCRVAAFQKRPGLQGGVFLDRGKIVSTLFGEPVTVMDTAELEETGRPHMENILAAVAVALWLDCPAEAVREGLKSFRGLPHRMERVRVLGDIRFIDDSKGTNVGALKGALESLSGPVILIAGGRDKGGDFRSLIPLIREKVRHLILLGEAASKLEAAWNGLAPATRVATLPEGVRRAWAISRPGDTVLLSPGCASFDMFRNFEERGDVFQKAVRNLTPEKDRRGD